MPLPLSNILRALYDRNGMVSQDKSQIPQPSIKEVRKFDNFFSPEVYKKISDMVNHTYQGSPNAEHLPDRWIPGHRSRGEQGESWFWQMIIRDNDFIHKECLQIINKKTRRKHKAERIYFNGMTVGQNASFHYDDEEADAWTFLLYVLPCYDFEWGGHTLFLDKDRKDLALAPLPNRGVYFPGRLLHKALCFNTNQAPMRVSLAYKLLEDK